MGVQSEALPKRLDWVFTYAQPSLLPDNQAKLSISIAGDSMVDATRSIQVPEEWSRAQKTQTALTESIGILRWLAWFLLILLASFQAILLWQRGLLNPRTIIFYGAIYALISCISSILSIPQALAGLSTAKPLLLQISTYLLFLGAKIFFESTIMGVLLAIIFSTRVHSAVQGLAENHRRMCFRFSLGGDTYLY